MRGRGGMTRSRSRGRLLRAALSLLAVASLVACFDLLHSTSDVRTACEIDAAHPGCSAEATPTDFCAWTSTEARQHAVHACAWLGACETPMGGNAFGPCVFQAQLAYDCISNPNHRAGPQTHRLWDCLQRAETCVDVDTCISARTPVCQNQGDYTNCKGDLRVHCTDGGVMPYAKALGSENCALWGKTCATGPDDTECAGSSSGLGCHEGDPKECVGTTSIHWCAAADGGTGSPDATGIDRGIDCASNGAGVCSGFPSADAARWVACQASSSAPDGGDDCEPNASATCTAGIAASCPSGVRETIDCATLLGSVSAAAACSEGPLLPPFDWTSPCALVPPECSGDSCDGRIVRSCERGAAFAVDCGDEGLGSCRLQTVDSNEVRAACTPPP